MIFNVRVIPKASRNSVIKEKEGLKVYLSKPAQDGLANTQLVGLLSEYLRVRKYQIRIIKGHKTRSKVVEVDA